MSKPYKCPVCEGSGQVIAPQAEGVSSAVTMVPCRACSNGLVWEPEPSKVKPANESSGMQRLDE